MTVPALSIIIPTLEEEHTIGRLLADLEALGVAHEVVVADGGSDDATADVACERGARVVRARRGRGTQLAEGARAANADVLCFLHADVRVGADALAELERIARSGVRAAYAFRLRIDSDDWRYRVVEWGANRLRTRWGGLPYGDQGLVVSRAAYDAAGGYPDVPLMEDVALVRALRRVTSIRLLDAALHVSPRRWEREGVLRRTLRNWRLLALFLAGRSPERLLSGYRPRERRPAA